MMKIVIYNVEEKNKVIYNLGILMEKKICIAKKSIGLLCNNNEIENVDRILWTFSSNFFVPHDIYKENDSNNNYEDKNENQPLLLTTDIKNIINRDIVCTLNQDDMINIIKDINNNNIEVKEDFELIYISCNLINDNIKKHIINCNTNNVNLTIDFYTQINEKWKQDK